MKKLFTAILATLMIITFTACGNSTTKKNSSHTAHDVKSSSKILVAYFSCTGKTKKAAEEVAEILHADIFEIVPFKPYTLDDLDYNIETCRANLEQKDSNSRPAIKNKIENPAQYKTIIIAYPIWWGAEPRIIDTFVESYDLKGRKIIPVCTSGGSEITTSTKNLQELCKGAKVLEGRRLGILSKEEIKAWLDSLNL